MKIEIGLKKINKANFSVDRYYSLVSNTADGAISVYDTKTKKQMAMLYILVKKSVCNKVIYHSPIPVGVLMYPNGGFGLDALIIF